VEEFQDLQRLLEGAASYQPREDDCIEPASTSEGSVSPRCGKEAMPVNPTVLGPST
jgi:hypothetical protein